MKVQVIIEVERPSARTLVTVSTEIQGMDDPEKLEFLTRMMQRSVKSLVETEVGSGEA